MAMLEKSLNVCIYTVLKVLKEKMLSGKVKGLLKLTKIWINVKYKPVN